jgi:hypothetical protein
MKKIIFTLSIGLLLLTGCSKENVEPQIQQQSEERVYVLINNGEYSTWESNSLNDFQSTYSNSSVVNKRVNNGNSAHTHGSFEGAPFTFNWSGTENNGGTHGSAIITQDFGPFIVTIIMETACVNVVGNEAVYGGLVTEVENSPFPPGAGPFAIGNIVFFKVIDNGQGNNAPADQYVQTLVSTSSLLECETLGQPDFSFWSLPFFATNDIEEPGSVKVNN